MRNDGAHCVGTSMKISLFTIFISKSADTKTLRFFYRYAKFLHIPKTALLAAQIGISLPVDLSLLKCYKVNYKIARYLCFGLRGEFLWLRFLSRLRL